MACAKKNLQTIFSPHWCGAAARNNSPFPPGSARAKLAGEYLCSSDEPYRGWLYAIIGDMEFFSNHLGCPGPNADEPCWLCQGNRDKNPWNDFVKDCFLKKQNSFCKLCQKGYTCFDYYRILRIRTHVSFFWESRINSHT